MAKLIYLTIILITINFSIQCGGKSKDVLFTNDNPNANVTQSDINEASNFGFQINSMEHTMHVNVNMIYRRRIFQSLMSYILKNQGHITTFTALITIMTSLTLIPLAH